MLNAISSRLARDSYYGSKRAVDMIVSLIAIVLLSPIFLLVAIAIKLEDGGAIIFKQERSGENDVPFTIYKFRSMGLSTASTTAHDYVWDNGVPDTFVFKNTGEQDARVTKVGNFIRKFSIDELPQFVNVLLGNMSLIGPRPEIVPITSCYSKEQKKRLMVKPGITGWAQINGRSDINNGEKIRLDLEYIEKKTAMLDVVIFFKTVWLVIAGKGSV
ncbi:bacterial sugar transferase family protein [Listeria grandensis FSL F6-0971]|uniref:Bacterial sugar transferase family protein n=1 Tax=Listeria grandensis FSL F6-0971 TaxID=1265819 RepID=W7BFW0_9LIST|nr:sugar transferase [Listeria grandensis]EUJ23725.1 bacterial sugar transferase family protein [Listeria grandensis FSL F6-0971]